VRDIAGNLAKAESLANAYVAASAPQFGEEKRMKRIDFLTLLISASLLLTVASPMSAAGPKVPAAPVAAAAPAPTPAAAMPERHPHIDEALESMRAAKHQLESAEHDFGGHRAKAIEHLDRAIHEAEICMSMR
jgi:hypothetical protein